MKKYLKYISIVLVLVVINIITPKIASAVVWDSYPYSIPYTVVTPSNITVTLSASPSTMTLPTNQTTLTWSTTNSPTTCTASNAWSGAKSTLGGSEVVSGLSAGTYTFTITCSKSGNSVTANAVVNVSSGTPSGLSVSISANPSTLPYGGGSSVITWSSSNAISCTGTNFNTNDAVSGNTTVNLISTTTYTVSCTGASRSTLQASTTVTVSPQSVVNGICAATHYSCISGSYPGGGTGGASGPWAWSCVGSGGGSTASCSEASGGGRAQCSDGTDNDGDGLVDSDDPGCHSDKDPRNDTSYLPNKNSEKDGIKPIWIEL